MRKIHLSKNKEALIDDDDFERISQFSWYFDGRYAARKWKMVDGKWKTFRMHRFVMGVGMSKVEVDHINGDMLDNRKENLRIANRQQNASNRKIPTTNSSGYKGVCWSRKAAKWQASIAVNGKRLHLGLFDDKKEAALAYDAATLKYNGNFAKTNEGSV